MSKKKIARILLVLAVVASLTLMELTPLSMVQDASAVTQADIDKLKDELSGMNSEKSQLEKELKSIQNDKSAALAQKENIDKQISVIKPPAMSSSTRTLATPSTLSKISCAVLPEMLRSST